VISPGQICPIIISAQHFDGYASPSERLIIPALFGAVPRWHKGNFREHGFNTVNFRVENMKDSRMYKPAFNRGRRCVLMCEGFYEWQQIPARLTPSERSVYFIHVTQPKGVKIEDNATWTCDTVHLLHVAGIFDVWHDEDRNPLYSFTIISKASDGSLSWLHPRTPAVLETQDQIESWINFAAISSEEALTVFTPPKNINWYRVSAQCVLNSSEKDMMCNRPEIEDVEERTASEKEEKKSKHRRS
jgi:putative SOS response-associated peptidase YedK